jgi:hypothetical protein
VVMMLLLGPCFAVSSGAGICMLSGEVLVAEQHTLRLLSKISLSVEWTSAWLARSGLTA